MINEIDDPTVEIKNVNVPMIVKDMIALKEKTGKKNMKDAINFAVRYFISHNEKVE